MRMLRCAIVILLLSLAVQSSAANVLVVMENIVSNTTSTAVSLPASVKTLYAEVVCSAGACAQTQAVYCDVNGDGANGDLLLTFTLSGTTRAQKVVTYEAVCAYVYVVTTSTSGTGAKGAIYAMF